MKNHKFDPTSTILGIKPWVLFRLGPSLSVHVRNLEDDSFYEVKGRWAYLWLSLDGVRTVGQAIGECIKMTKVKGPKFQSLARKFFDDLVKINLVTTISPYVKKDKRAQDMKGFLKLLHNGPLKSNFAGHKAMSLGIKNKSGDSEKLKKVRNNFLKFFKNHIQLKIKKESTSGRGIYIFKAKLSWPNHKFEPSEGFGAAPTAEGAAMAAAGEAIERHFMLCPRPVVFSKSYDDLVRSQHKALDPESYKSLAPSQDIIKNKEVIPLTRKTKTNWEFFEDALHQGEILIPQELNAVRFQKGSEPMIYDFSSNGCAADTEKDRAKLKAALELIERDSVLFYWRTRNAPLRINLSKPNTRIGSLLEKMGDLKKRLNLFYLKTDLATVTVQATLLGDPSLGEPEFAHAAATRLDATEAIEKALIELLYVTNGFKSERKPGYFGENYDNSIWTFGDRADIYGYYSMSQAYKFLFPKKQSQIQIADIPQMEMGNSAKNLEALIQDFRRHSLRLYFQNSTPPYIRASTFWVYRAFSPDLISIDSHHRFRGLGYARYYSLPSKLGLKRKPKWPRQLNPWPHPIT